MDKMYCQIQQDLLSLEIACEHLYSNHIDNTEFWKEITIKRCERLNKNINNFLKTFNK